MPKVTFYQLSDDSPQAVQKRACALIADAYAQRQRIVVWCANQGDAEAIDELLWQLPAERFIPHNLAGEGPAGGAPVEVHWQTDTIGQRPFLVNLSGRLPTTLKKHQRIIDFVPAAEGERQAARQRYKQYQQAGCNMQFIAAEHESTHG